MTFDSTLGTGWVLEPGHTKPTSVSTHTPPRQSVGHVSTSPWTISGSRLWPFFQLIRPEVHLGRGVWLSVNSPCSRSAEVSAASKIKRSKN